MANKLYKEIITNEADFDTKVWNKLKARWAILPNWLDDSKIYFKKAIIHDALKMNYDYKKIKFANEEEFLGHFKLALWDLLPSLYVKSIYLKNETLDEITWTSILETVNENYKDPTRNTIRTMEASSDSPTINDDIEALTSPSTKNINIVRDNTKTFDVSKDVGLAINTITALEVDGLLFDFVNHYKLNRLFELN